MSAGHAEGPWQILPEEAGKAYIRIRGTRIGSTYKIANVLVHTYPGAGDRELIEARNTARLIAAAPDLLQALEAVLNWIDDNCETTGFDAVEAQADAALAKVRGADVGGEVT